MKKSAAAVSVLLGLLCAGFCSECCADLAYQALRLLQPSPLLPSPIYPQPRLTQGPFLCLSPPTPRCSSDNFSLQIRDLGLFKRVFNLQPSEMCYFTEKKKKNLEIYCLRLTRKGFFWFVITPRFDLKVQRCLMALERSGLEIGTQMAQNPGNWLVLAGFNDLDSADSSGVVELCCCCC